MVVERPNLLVLLDAKNEIRRKLTQQSRANRTIREIAEGPTGNSADWGFALNEYSTLVNSGPDRATWTEEQHQRLDVISNVLTDAFGIKLLEVVKAWDTAEPRRNPSTPNETA